MHNARPQHAAYIEAASDFFKMTKTFPTSTLISEPDRDDKVVKRFQRVHYWPFASGDILTASRRFRGKAGIERPSVRSDQ